MRVTMLIVASLIYSAASGPGTVLAQSAPDSVLPDSVRAVAAGRRAAREPLVTGYFLGAAIAGPMAIVGFGVAGGGGLNEHPELLAYPLPLVALGGLASRTPTLPDSVEMMLAGESAAYAVNFRRAYAKEVKARRTRAIVLGTATGLLAAIYAIAQMVPYT